MPCFPSLCQRISSHGCTAACLYCRSLCLLLHLCLAACAQLVGLARCPLVPLCPLDVLMPICLLLHLCLHAAGGSGQLAGAGIRVCIEAAGHQRADGAEAATGTGAGGDGSGRKQGGSWTVWPRHSTGSMVSLKHRPVPLVPIVFYASFSILGPGSGPMPALWPHLTRSPPPPYRACAWQLRVWPAP